MIMLYKCSCLKQHCSNFHLLFEKQNNVGNRLISMKFSKTVDVNPVVYNFIIYLNKLIS